jgi:hypothetical protein
VTPLADTNYTDLILSFIEPGPDGTLVFGSNPDHHDGGANLMVPQQEFDRTPQSCPHRRR